MDFTDFNLDPAIMDGIKALGYVNPTPIQEHAIPPILAGKDLIGLAQTGTGKTAAFALPILQRLMHQPRGKVRAGVISPTRELAEQTSVAFNDLGAYTGLRSAAIYGGVSMDRQLRVLKAGVEIVVGCPGRLIDHLWGGTVDFSRLDVLVIDEADRMFDMGFLPGIRMVLECILERKQTLLFSATMPADIRRLVDEILHDPVTVRIGRQMPAATVSHALYPVEEHLKAALLKKVLRTVESDSVLVFTRTKYRARRLAEQLRHSGFAVAALEGDMTQPQREHAFNGFRDGSFKILVATDIAARGIDVLSISHVVNYDVPDDTDSYIHRIGRTGRVDQHGQALTFVTRRDTPVVRDLEKVLGGKLEHCTLPDFDYDVPAPEREPARRPYRPPRRVPSAHSAQR